MRALSIVLGGCLLAACGGGDTRVCFGATEFCQRTLAANDPPRADAGPDLQASSGEPVTLDGSRSRDGDGRIETYSWSQVAGPTVALAQAATAAAAFRAPPVEETLTLSFRLVVTDDDDASDTDSVTVTVVPAAAGAGADPVQLQRQRCWLPCG